MKLTDFAAVIFDMDGLVLDTETTYCFAKQLAGYVLGYEFSEQFWMSMSGLHQKDIEQKLFAYGGADFDLAAFNDTANAIWHDYVDANGINTMHGFFQLLDFIVEQSMPYCLATNSNAVNADKCLKYAGLQDVFPVIITRDDVRQGKPEPDIFLTAASTLNVDIARCLVLEDSHAGILAASRAGAFSVFVPSVLPVEPLTLSLCDVMISDLESVLKTMRA
jgi:beta-phosphoglucomutase-like phosphatase (HAD superfamily)